MLCFASMLVLGILSIFGAKYRKLAREALDCVFRRVTFRPCTTGFDVKVKSTLLSWLLAKSPFLARNISKRFDVIAFALVILMSASAAYSIRGIYNFWAYGNCNGLNQGGFCAFDPTGKNNAVSGTGIGCIAGGGLTGNLTLQNVNLDSFYLVPGTDKEMVFIGCYACKYTKSVYPLIKKLIDQYKPTIRWVFYPAHPESEYLAGYDYCIQQLAPLKYPLWMDQLYTRSIEEVGNESATLQLIKSLDIDSEMITQCVQDPKTQQETTKRKYEIDKTGIYGTPTIFLNETPVVGPKPERVYRRLLNETWF